MVAVPISGSENQGQAAGQVTGLVKAAPVKAGLETDMALIVAGSTVVAGGALIVAGHKRAGLAIALAGTALALLEDREIVESWWKNMPGYLQDAQNMLDKVEGYMKEATAQGQRLQGILRR